MNAVTLPRYARIIGYTECAFFGVAHPANNRYECREIWLQHQRDEIEFYLAEAQEEIELVIDYPLKAKWFEEETPYSCPAITRWGNVIEAGIQAWSDLSLGLLVNHTTDPTVTTFTPASIISSNQLSSIHVFYPGTDLEIIPSSITLDGDGDVVITIPRCRMVGYDSLENPEHGWNYDDEDNFQDEIDVRLEYNDTSQQATLLWPHHCTDRCSTSECSEGSQDACIYISNKEIGKVLVNAAEYRSGTWYIVRSNCNIKTPVKMNLYYKAGLTTLTRIAESTIVRLAHSKMPTEPCGCEITQRLWKRDRRIPDILTKDRLECPFGLSDGAWTAWKFAQAIALVRGDIL